MAQRYRHQNGLCFYCSCQIIRQKAKHTYNWAKEAIRTVRIATIDHVWPRSRGGANETYNKVWACSPCNNAKGDREPTDDEVERLRALNFNLFGIPWGPRRDLPNDGLFESPERDTVSGHQEE